MGTRRVSAVVLVLPALAPVVNAQLPRDPAPLKYWPAPLYWQPGQSEKGVRPEAAAAVPGTAPPAQTPANSLVFVGMTPCRVADTRSGFGFSGAFGPPSLAGGATRAFPIQASTTCPIPSIAKAYSFNLTVVTSSFLNYITVWPYGSTQPNASTLNDDLGTVVANAAIIPAGNDGSGSINVYASNNTDFIIDINGYYAAQTGITLAQGIASAPSLSFAGDAGTGVYSSSAGMINMSSGGTQAFSVGGSGRDTSVGAGALAIDTGTDNTAIGNSALQSNTTGVSSTAVGSGALASNTGGTANTALGSYALSQNTIGFNNTAAGASAMVLNTSGQYNSAYGVLALQSNMDGNNNTAIGAEALVGNEGGSNNTAVGYEALYSDSATGNTAVGNMAMYWNMSGNSNAAVGDSALYNNTTGSSNTATGVGALYSNITAANNTADGFQTLDNNSTGMNNTAVGYRALLNNTTGGQNTAVGYLAGEFATTGSNNIHIGSYGVSTDNATIRIGIPLIQTSFFAAGVYGSAASGGVPVYVNSNGQFGTSTSSRRYKEDIRDMDDASSALLQLRPVTFRYKQPYADGSKPIDYGLIAEEVAEIYPDLVVKNADGQIETVQYQKLTPMLLNEVQKQSQRIDEQAETIRLLVEKVGVLEEKLR